MRVFFCADVPAESKHQIARWVAGAMAERFPTARWVPTENYHMTLDFIGAIEQKHVPVYQEMLRQLADEQIFDVCASRLIWLPDEARRRVLALEVTSGHLLELSRRLNPSGSFIGHITLARPAARMDPLGLLTIADADVRFTVVRLSLRQSMSGPEGVSYPELSGLSLVSAISGWQD